MFRIEEEFKIMENHEILVQIKTNLDRLIATEFPKIERGLYEQDVRLRHLEMSQIKLDMMVPKIDAIGAHLNSIDDLVEKKAKPLNDKVERLEKQIDELRAYMWKTTGAVAILAIIAPFLANKFFSL